MLRCPISELDVAGCGKPSGAKKLRTRDGAEDERETYLLHEVFLFLYTFSFNLNKMAAEVVDDHEMREAQREYLDFLDDDVSNIFVQLFWTKQ